MTARSAWAVGAGAAALASAVALVPGLAEALEYDRAAIATGDWWRVATSHWTHWSADHLVWDAVALAVLLALALRESVRRGLATLALASLAIPAAIAWLLPQMTRYRGLSGLDSALFVLVALALRRRARTLGDRGIAAIAAIALAAFAGKVVFELASGATLFTDATGFVPVPLAHLVGGLCAAIGSSADTRPRMKKGHPEGCPVVSADRPRLDQKPPRPPPPVRSRASFTLSSRPSML